MNLQVDNSFIRELPADTILENDTRQVSEACYSYTQPTPCSHPQVVHISEDMLSELGLSVPYSHSPEFLSLISGNALYPNTHPYAMCYGGHQFGHWAGQLGDGRAINLFEIISDNHRWTLQLKGAGKTPYSRDGDGLAVLRSSIREYLCSEAMYHLGVPTTRALSLVTTGDPVLRDILYNGNAAYESGAIVCRVAPSFIRFGNFQILAARKEYEILRKLTDYTIHYFYPHIHGKNKESYLQFFEEISMKTMDMIVHWERVGFVHGVMNTDNMSILGLTIDYGPYGWLEGYDPSWTPNTTDAQHRRYRYENQAEIALWNLMQLANALYPIIEDVSGLESILHRTRIDYHIAHRTMYLSKLGLDASIGVEIADKLIADLKKNLEESEMDYTLFFRNLSRFDGDMDVYIHSLQNASYSSHFSDFISLWTSWFEDYESALLKFSLEDRKTTMNTTNPKYIFRNYMAQLAIDAAEKGDYTRIEEYYQLLKKPYDEQPESERWFALRPDWAGDRVGCSMLSCSS